MKNKIELIRNFHNTNGIGHEIPLLNGLRHGLYQHWILGGARWKLISFKKGLKHGFEIVFNY